ncbi:MAG: helix-turn-helix transcriptional regulator [Bacteroidales bacterium]|nr:helix-turn-helix domain-containing protein [Bacteroidales bacterium]
MMQERILLLMKSFGMNPTQFADEIGVQRSSISHILSGRNNPSLDIVTKILNRFPEIDSNWLVLGKGSLVEKSKEKLLDIGNIEISKSSENLFDDISDNLFTDNQINNRNKKDQNTIDELQRKIEILEGRTVSMQNNPINKDIAVSYSKIGKSDDIKENIIIEKKEDSNSSSITNINSDILSSSINDSNKHIRKIIILYSDNSYEELIKN